MPNEEQGLAPVEATQRKKLRGKLLKKKGITFIIKDAKNAQLAKVSEFITFLNTGEGSEKISGKIVIG